VIGKLSDRLGRSFALAMGVIAYGGGLLLVMILKQVRTWPRRQRS
jgi:hypothetical protein